MTQAPTRDLHGASGTLGRGHRWYAATYDFINRGAERRVLGPMRQWLRGDLSGRVLEVGAGTGANFPD